MLELTRPLTQRHEIVHDVRGLGLIWAIEFAAPSGRARRTVFNALERAQPGLFAQLITVPLFHEHRILIQVAGHRMNVVKALPSLLIDEAEVRRFADALADAVAKSERTARAMTRLGLTTAHATVGAHRPKRATAA